MANAYIPVTLKVIETDKQLAKLMLVEVAKELNRRIPRVMKSMGDKMREETFKFLQRTDTYDSLIGGGIGDLFGDGSLAVHFGLPPDGRSQRIDAIVLAVANRMEIEYIPINVHAGKFTNGIKFRVLTRDLSEVINLPEGFITTEKGQVLDWLHWLLTMGDRVIISEYEIRLGYGKGRSGGGIMIADKAGVWRVPPEYSGTMRNNWLTRAFKDNPNVYLSIIEKIIQAELQRI